MGAVNHLGHHVSDASPFDADNEQIGRTLKSIDDHLASIAGSLDTIAWDADRRRRAEQDERSRYADQEPF